MNTRNIDTPTQRAAPAPEATGTVTPWQHFVLPPDPPATRINASLFKTGLRHFHAVVFDQKGEMTQVSRKRWPARAPSVDRAATCRPPGLRGSRDKSGR